MVIDGILHTLRDESDLESILKNGLLKGSNISLDYKLPNQSYTGQGITLLYDKSKARFKPKGYNSNEGILLSTIKSPPLKILIGADDFKEYDDISDDDISKNKLRKDYLDKNFNKIKSKINSRLSDLWDNIMKYIRIEHEQGHTFLYTVNLNGEFLDVLDITGFEVKELTPKNLYSMYRKDYHVFKQTPIGNLINKFLNLEDKLSELDYEYTYLNSIGYSEIIENRGKIDYSGLIKYIKTLHLPPNIPVYYYTTNLDGSANIEIVENVKISQLDVLKLLENMNNSSKIYEIIYGDGYIFDSQLKQINIYDGKSYGELLDGRKLIKFNNGQLQKYEDFDENLLCMHKFTKLYGQKGNIKTDSIVPMVFVKIFPNYSFKSGYFPMQAIEFDIS